VPRPVETRTPPPTEGVPTVRPIRFSDLLVGRRRSSNLPTTFCSPTNNLTGGSPILIRSHVPRCDLHFIIRFGSRVMLRWGKMGTRSCRVKVCREIQLCNGSDMEPGPQARNMTYSIFHDAARENASNSAAGDS
jgi:hypothetical protein